MTHLDPILLEALKAAMPKEAAMLEKVDRNAVQREIETLITSLHPDGLSASEILVALTVAVVSRYDHKYQAVERIEEASRKLQEAFEEVV